MLVSVTVVVGQPTGAPGIPAAEKAIRWGPIGLGGGGAYMCIALARSDSKVNYVGGDVGGIWKSDDRGQSWQIRNGEVVHAIFPGGTYNCCHVAVHPTDEKIVYAAMTRGLMQTVDGGKTWRLLYHGGRAAGALVLDPARPRTIYCGGRHDSRGAGPFRSDDAGATWQRLGAGLPPDADVRCLVVDPTSPVENRTIVVGTNRGLFRWHGDRFLDISKGLPHRSMTEIAGGTDPTNGHFVVYVALESVQNDTTFSGGLFRTNDDGQTWNGATPSKFRPGERRIGQFGSLVVHPDDANVVYAAASAVWFFRTNVPTSAANSRRVFCMAVRSSFIFFSAWLTKPTGSARRACSVQPVCSFHACDILVRRPGE